MLDIAPSELLLVAFVALVVIGPKDLPKAMRVVSYWVGKARGVGRQFRSGFDAMVREAELEEMEKKWAAENERIMREHPSVRDSSDLGGTENAAGPITAEGQVETVEQASLPLDDAQPVMVERPHVVPAPATAAPGEPVIDETKTPL